MLVWRSRQVVLCIMVSSVFLLVFGYMINGLMK